MRLLVHDYYRNPTLRADWRPGQIIEVDSALADFLLRDSPGTFAPIQEADHPPANTMIGSPAADDMMHRPIYRTATGRLTADAAQDADGVPDIIVSTPKKPAAIAKRIAIAARKITRRKKV